MTARRLPGGFWKLLTAGFVSNIGDGLALVAFPWLAVTMTDQPILIAGVAIAAKAPWLVFSLPAGVIIDRSDRRRAMVASNIVRGVVTAVVAALVAAGHMNLPLAYLALLVLGCAEVVYDNSLVTMVPAVVTDKDQLFRANGWVHAAQNVANDFLGAPIAGLVAGFALFLPFALQSVAATASAIMLALIAGSYVARGDQGPTAAANTAATTGPATGPTTGPTTAPARARSGARAELAEGLSWLWRHPLFRFFALTSSVMSATGAAILAIYVLFAREIVGLGPTGYGLTLAVGGAGMVAGTRLVDWTARRLGRARVLRYGLFGHGVIFLVCAVSPHVLVVSAVLFCWGLFGAYWNVITLSLRQVLIPDHLLGRVGSAYRLIGVGGPATLGVALGSVIVTVVAATATRDLGLRMPFIIGAAASLAIGVASLSRVTEHTIAAAEADLESTNEDDVTEPVAG